MVGFRAAAVTGSLVLSVGIVLPALASEGGEGGSKANLCPYAQDQHVHLGEQELIVSQSVFDPKTEESNVDGYRLVPDVQRLELVIITPQSDVWKAGLSVVLGGKKCVAYYVGDPRLVGATQSTAAVVH